MSNVDTREVSRDSFFLLAEIRPADDETSYRLRVRNLSSSGMMADGNAPLELGSEVSINLRNIGEVKGRIAWKQGERCGISFERDINPALARTQTASPDMDKFTVRRPAFAFDSGAMRANLRNI